MYVEDFVVYEECVSVATGRVSENVLQTTHADSLVRGLRPGCRCLLPWNWKWGFTDTTGIDDSCRGGNRNARACPSEGAKLHTAVDRRQGKTVCHECSSQNQGQQHTAVGPALSHSMKVKLALLFIMQHSVYFNL